MAWLLKKENRFTLRLIAIVLEGLFALGVIIMFLNMSFGWFTQNKKLTGSGVMVAAADPGIIQIQEYRIYKHSEENNTVMEVSNSVEGDPLFEAPVTMNKYDTILTERNHNTHIVLCVTIDDVNTAKSAIDIDLSHTQPLVNGTAPLTRYLSNICAVRCTYGAQNDTPTQIYNAFASEAAGQSFVSVTHTQQGGNDAFSNQKIGMLHFSLTDFASHVYQVSGVNKLRVYIEISYNDELVREYLAQNQIGIDSSLEDFLTMEADFTYDFLPFALRYVD